MLRTNDGHHCGAARLVDQRVALAEPSEELGDTCRAGRGRELLSPAGAGRLQRSRWPPAAAATADCWWGTAEPSARQDVLHTPH